MWHVNGGWSIICQLWTVINIYLFGKKAARDEQREYMQLQTSNFLNLVAGNSGNFILVCIYSTIPISSPTAAPSPTQPPD